MKKSRVLIVDDDPEVREALYDELCTAYDVEVATGGNEALRVLSQHRFDGIVSDLRMPDVDGIAVLDAARQRDPEMVRILLTGYADQAAHRALQRVDAPLKISKPWHDGLEVALRRGFEQRATRHALSESFSTALELTGVDDDLAAAEGLIGLANVVVDRLSRVRGIASAEVKLDLDEGEQSLASFAEPPVDEPMVVTPFDFDEPFSSDGSARAHVSGRGERQAMVARALLARARRWTSEDPMTQLSRIVSIDADAQDRLLALARRATMGTMAASLYHELASVLNVLFANLEELGPYLERTQAPQRIREAYGDAVEAAQRGTSLFSAMRLFVHDGQQSYGRWTVEELLAKAIQIAAPKQKARVTIRGAHPGLRIDGIAPLLVQVFVNLLRNAFEASPPEAPIEIEVRRVDGYVEIAVIDHGPGVAPDHRARLFQPFFTTKGSTSGTGLGLAFAKKVVLDHTGTLGYDSRRETQGATFIVRLPLAAVDAVEPA